MVPTSPDNGGSTVVIACEQAPSEGEKKFGARSEWDAGEPVDIVFVAPFRPLMITLLQK